MRAGEHAALVCPDIAGATAALIDAIAVLADRDFGFSVTSTVCTGAAYAHREIADLNLVRIAESHCQRRLANRADVLVLQRWLIARLVGAVIEVHRFAVAVA